MSPYLLKYFFNDDEWWYKFGDADVNDLYCLVEDIRVPTLIKLLITNRICSF